MCARRTSAPRCVLWALGVGIAIGAAPRSARGWFEANAAGARAFGFAGAFVSAADDPSALYWNPAGLVQLRRHELLLSFDQRNDLPELRNGFAAVALQASPVVVGAGWQHSGVTGVSSEDLWSLGVAAAPVRRSLGAFVAVGATVKLARVDVEPPLSGTIPAGIESATGVAADLGLLVAPIPNVFLGTALRNLGEPRFDLVAGGSSTRLEQEFEWGVSLRWRRDCWLHLARVRHPGTSTATRAGVELRIGAPLGLRAGVARDLVAGGVEVRSGRWSFDSACQAHTALGVTYRVALRLAFGGEHAGVGGQYDDF